MSCGLWGRPCSPGGPRFLAAEFVAGALQAGVGDLGPWLLECAASSWWSQVLLLLAELLPQHPQALEKPGKDWTGATWALFVWHCVSVRRQNARLSCEQERGHAYCVCLVSKKRGLAHFLTMFFLS